jgi:outer membrane protein assembly factor BamB
MIRLLGCILAALPCFAATDWSQFRGPNGNGVADEPRLPVEFGPNKNVVWKTPLPRGASSPVLAGDRIFLTGAEGNRLITFCIDRVTGKILWQREILAGRAEALHKLNDPASSSPITDGRNVYVFFGNFGLVSYGPDGRERWKRPLGPFTNLHGMGASPVLSGGKLIMICDQNNDSYLLAVDKDDGHTLWKTERPEVTHGFSTPILYRPESGPQQLIVPGSYQLISYAVETGEKLWWVRGLTWQVKSMPVISGNVLYFNNWAPGGDAGEQAQLPEFREAIAKADANHDGKLAQAELPKEWQPTGSWGAVDLDRDGLLNERDWSFFRARRAAENSLMAIRLGGAGDLTDTNVLWRYRKVLPDVPCPLLYQGVLFLVKTGGIATSLDPATGKVLKQARLTGALDGYYSSPVGADGKVYMISQAGKVSVLKAAGEWEILAQNDLEDEAYATPAIAGGKIYLRTRGMLYCFAEPAK